MGYHERLIELRKKNNYTQEELAGIIGVSRQAISKWESGASPRLEHEPTSKYFFCLGDHASTSIDLTFKSARSPEQHSRVLTGISRLLNKSTVFFQSLSNHILLSSGLHTTIISCFSKIGRAHV